MVFCLYFRSNNKQGSLSNFPGGQTVGLQLEEGKSDTPTIAKKSLQQQFFSKYTSPHFNNFMKESASLFDCICTLSRQTTPYIKGISVHMIHVQSTWGCCESLKVTLQRSFRTKLRMKFRTK